MTTANLDFSEETYNATSKGTENAKDIGAGDATPLVYSPEMNQEILRQLAEVNAIVLAKVGSLSPEQQAQFHALIEQGNLIEANGHLDS
jgi:hypothetical protein